MMQSIHRDWTTIGPGDVYQLDHAKFDLWCRVGDDTVRPCKEIAQLLMGDGRSRMTRPTGPRT